MANKPFFLPQKEVNLFDAINEELIDDIIGQTVDIYKIEVDDSNTNMYGESETKYFKAAFRVNCLISFDEPEVSLSEIGTDFDAKIEMYFHRTSLEEANFYPEIGDIVEWNGHYFEMNTIVEPQLLHGHQNYKHQIKAHAHRIRNSSLQIEQRT